MNRRILILAFGLILALAVLAPGAKAQDGGDDDDVLIRVNGTTRLAPGDQADTVVGVNGDVLLDGTVRDTLLVFNADAVVTGAVEGGVAVVNGSLDLRPGARVDGDVTLVRSTLTRAPDATVGGDVSRRSGFSFGRGATIFSALFWVGMTAVVLLAGLLFAAVGGRQLTAAGALLLGRPGPSVVAAAVLWIGIPIVAVVSFLTLIGIPLGLVLLLVVLPALWVLGYLVAGTRLGAELLRRAGRPQSATAPPYLAAVVGLLALQLVGLIPIVGGLVVGLAGLVGAGALVYLAWRAWRGARPRAAVPAAGTAPA
jgi:Ca2+-binding RTX toxin-like protein